MVSLLLGCCFADVMCHRCFILLLFIYDNRLGIVLRGLKPFQHLVMVLLSF